MRMSAMVAGVLMLAGLTAWAGTEEGRCGLWIDLYFGEPIAQADMLADLAGARVVYLGERHTIDWHHQLQAQIVADLAQRGVRLVIGLESMEPSHQAALDRFHRKEIDIDQLAQTTDWARRWRNWQQYRPILELARRFEVPLIALNAPAQVIRQVARNGGVAKLDEQARRQLPAQMQLDDPPYAKLLSLQMMVHASASPERLRPMIEAQIARDEAMAAALTEYLQSSAGEGRTAVVICGAGHASYGLGMPSRVRRRMPEARQQIVLFSESGDVELSAEERAQAREFRIAHDDLRGIGRPIGDYLYAKALKP